MFKNILVPIDGGDLSSQAVEAACDFAQGVGARLTFYHAKPTYIGGYVSGEMMMSDPRVEEAFVAQTNERAEALLARAAQAASRIGVGFETVSTASDLPHEGIIDAARSRGCDLIFMASHGRRGIGALLLGSETQKVLTHCGIPVLVYRKPG